MSDASHSFALSHSAITRYHITAAPVADFLLPPHPGSMLRGALGHALRFKFCQCEHTDAHQPDCLYQLIFEGLRKQQQDGIPAFVMTPLDAQKKLKAHQPFQFDLTLLGLPLSMHEAFLDALQMGLYRGLGRDNTPCELVEYQQVPLCFTPLQQAATLHLTTPWMIKRKGKIMTAETTSLHDVLIALAQRQRRINQALGLNLAVPDNTQLLQLADKVTVQTSLENVSWQRHSQRQSVKHPLRGIKGVLNIHHPDPTGLAPLSALLSLGCILHGGGKTAFGLGGLALGASNNAALLPASYSF